MAYFTEEALWDIVHTCKSRKYQEEQPIVPFFEDGCVCHNQRFFHQTCYKGSLEWQV